jgi:arylsulfatase
MRVMEIKEMCQPYNTGRSVSVLLGLSVGLSAGLLDVACRLLMSSYLDGTAMAAAPFVATVTFVWAAAAVTAGSLSALSRGLLGWARVFPSVALAWGLLVPATNFFLPVGELLPNTANGWFTLIVVSSLAVALGRWSYRMLAEPAAGRSGRWSAGFAPVVPLLVSAAVLLWVCVHTEWRTAAPNGSLFKVVMILAGAVLLVHVLGWSRAHGGWTVRCVNVVAMLSVFIPFGLRAGPDATQAAPRLAERPKPVRRVILLSVDTLRADALSCYGGSTPTPNIDAIAQDAILFDRAISPAPWTLPAFASIMTGVYPAVHGATQYWSRVPLELETLAEWLRAAGYYTAAIGDNAFLTFDTNMSQGFDEYHFSAGCVAYPSFGSKILQRLLPSRHVGLATSRHLTRMASAWLERNADREFFFWLHYFDPHLPYAPPPELMPPGTPPPSIGPSLEDRNQVISGYLGRTYEEREWIKALYMAEVRYVDECIGQVVATLKRLGIYDDTLVVFVSDHGEEFWEHGSFEHGHSLYDELIHVPLLIKPPLPSRERTATAVASPDVSSKGSRAHGGVETADSATGATAALRVSRPVSTTALMPTILDLCGIDYDDEVLSVASIAPILSRTVHTPGVVHSGSPLYYQDRRAVLVGETKYIWSDVTGREELYELSRDQRERTSVALTSRDAVRNGRNLFEGHLRSSHRLRQRLGLKSDKASMSASRLERLKSLGYVN